MERRGELQDLKRVLRYNHVKCKAICFLKECIRNRRVTMPELKEHFDEILPEADLRAVRGVKNVKKLVKVLEARGHLGPNNVEVLRVLAEDLSIPELKEKVEKFEKKYAGILQKTTNAVGRASGFTWEMITGGARSLRTLAVRVIAREDFQNALMRIALDRLDRVFGVPVVAHAEGSVIFVLKFSCIKSLKRLWQSYKDGSLKEKLKKAFTEMEELKELSQGEEIDVEVTIDEDEYREVLWDLMQFEIKGDSTKTTKLKRRHSVCCERDVPDDSSKPIDVTQIQIRVEQPVAELEKSICNIKRLKEKLAKRFDEGCEWSRIAELEVQRLSEIRRQLSEMEIFIAASGFLEIRLKKTEERRRLAEILPLQIPELEVVPKSLTKLTVAESSEREREIEIGSTGDVAVRERSDSGPAHAGSGIVYPTSASTTEGASPEGETGRPSESPYTPEDETRQAGSTSPSESEDPTNDTLCVPDTIDGKNNKVHTSPTGDQQQITIKNENNETLEEENRDLKEQKKRLKDGERQLKQQNETLREQNRDLKEQKKRLKDGERQLKHQKELEENKRQLIEQNKKLEEDKTQLILEQNKKPEEHKRQLNWQNKKQMDDVIQLIEQNKKLEEQNKKREEQNKKLEEQNKKREEQNKKREEQNKKREEQNKKREEQNKKLEEQNKKLEEQNKKLEEDKRQLIEKNKKLGEDKR